MQTNDYLKFRDQPVSQWPKPPLPNSYWVIPGRLLAGEYPGGSSLADTTTRLQKLLSAGVTMFVDLTAEGELSSYHTLFDYVQGEATIQHVRHRIKDHDVPEAPQTMMRILDAIETHLAQNGTVYVHCRAGIGRTGTAVGCFLIRSGYQAEEALDRLNELWTESERSRTWPSIPETEAQIEFIRAWETTDTKLVSLRAKSSAVSERYAGALLGLAIGDALGALVVPAPPAVNGGKSNFVSDLVSGGPHNVPRGSWLADTAMCWALAESLLECNGSNPQDQMQRYLSWQREGKYSSTNTALNVPTEVGKALAQWQWTRKAIAGSHDPNNRDAHPLARVTATVLYFAKDPGRLIVEAGESARSTLQAPVVLDACRAFAVAVLDALDGVDKDTLLSFKRSDNAQRLRKNRLKLPVTQVLDGWWRGPAPPAKNERDILSVLGTALWAFDQTNSFRDGVLLAVNSSANPTSSGAAFGALAGAYYGLSNIPQEWRHAVARSRELMELAQRLAQRT